MEIEDSSNTPDQSPPERDRPDWRLPGNLVGIAILLVIIPVGLIWWSPWDSLLTCSDDETHVVDETSGLCYAHPEDWPELSDSELAAEAAELGRTPSTSSLRNPDGHVAWIHVGPIGNYVSGSISDRELESLARELATSSSVMSEGEPEVESEAISINGHQAGTATAQMPHSLWEEGSDQVLWVRATVVDVEGGTSVMITTALVERGEIDAEDGTIAILGGIHESIAVK